jgi:hypothetical protein
VGAHRRCLAAQAARAPERRAQPIPMHHLACSARTRCTRTGALWSAPFAERSHRGSTRTIAQGVRCERCSAVPRRAWGHKRACAKLTGCVEGEAVFTARGQEHRSTAGSGRGGAERVGRSLTHCECCRPSRSLTHCECCRPSGGSPVANSLVGSRALRPPSVGESYTALHQKRLELARGVCE